MTILLSAIPIAVIVLVALILLYNSVAIAKGDQIIMLERRWFGKSMPDGRTVALKGEVGVQARILGPGFHLLIPFIYKVIKDKYKIIGSDQVGIVTARTGVPIPSGQFFATPVECDLFQDGETFLTKGGQKGQQIHILPPGEYRINTYLFEVSSRPATEIGQDEVGIVEAVAGKPIRAGRIFADPVESDNFQDGGAFIANGGQKGPQPDVLSPGFYRINPLIFSVKKKRATVIPSGNVGMVMAMDGERIPEGRLLAKKVDGHANFEKGDQFIIKGGEKGRQLDVLMPGTYRINTDLFQVSEPQPWVNIDADQVGIVTVLEGKTITDPSKIAADEIDLNIHQNFQDPNAFLQAGGQKGLQIPVLRAGNYAINPWFAMIDKVDMIRVEIGYCGVVTSYVGPEGEDLTNEEVNAKIVAIGKKGIWSDPLQPGKHPLNTKICKVDIVPTTQILLNWADNRSSAHELDSNLKTITLRTADAFNVNMDVSVIIHIPMKNAPKVIANLGSVKNMISQVLEPAISSHFRNAAQYIEALDLYTKRKELQEKAKEHIDAVLKVHHIDSKDTLIADVVLPIELTKPVTDRQIAEQEKKTYTTQKEAQEERRSLENSKAQADMQPEVVASERNVEIAKNKAEGTVKEAEGEKLAAILKAEGDSESMQKRADGEAYSVKVKADATAESTTKVGTAEAGVILAKGTSNAQAYKLEVDAMGRDVFGQIRVIKEIAASNLKLIPDNLVIGGGSGTGTDGNGMVNGLFGIALMERLTGREFVAKPATIEPETHASEKKG